MVSSECKTNFGYQSASVSVHGVLFSCNTFNLSAAVFRPIKFHDMIWPSLPFPCHSSSGVLYMKMVFSRRALS